ncbi:hypothetical protein EAI_07636 [Harpegnathos saltator]|uniref:Uncharacterized protein n=1 Tax=Harpegnathos saltator TaxID=610380 RepID=E2B4N7_HARSA|nr:hypothetical protein EAI_07636 [Harpegnathos saltator]
MDYIFVFIPLYFAGSTNYKKQGDNEHFFNMILIGDSPHGEPPPGERGWRRRLSSRSPVDGLAPEGLDRFRHGPEGFLTGFRDHAAVPNAIVEITGATTSTTTTTTITTTTTATTSTSTSTSTNTNTTTAAATVEAVPPPHGAPVSAVIAAIMATWTAKLAGVLVHPVGDPAVNGIYSFGWVVCGHNKIEKDL